LLDKSIELQIDATNLLPSIISDSDLTIEMSIPALNQVTSYTLKFELPVPIDSTGKCFVKYTFPDELDISGLDLDTIQGKGLFVDRTGFIKSFRERYLVN